jgi:hypothetical protein
MIRLINILNEASPALFPRGVESPMLKLVWSDKSGSFKQSKIRDRFIKVIEKELNKAKANVGYDYDVKKILDGIQYYPATDKFVGNMPINVFFNQRMGKLFAPDSAVNIDRCAFKNELMKISKDIEVKKK